MVLRVGRGERGSAPKARGKVDRLVYPRVMSLTDSLLRASWPLLMATRSGRRLPGRLAPRLGPGFLTAVKRVNGERLARAEGQGRATFGAYPGFITVAGTSRCNIRCEFCINQ